jgi:hypothetical protein
VDIVSVILIAIFVIIALGTVALVPGLAVAGVWNFSQGKAASAAIFLLAFLAVPAYHFYDWHRGDKLGKDWADLKIASKPDSFASVVLVQREARYCGHICREALARGFVDHLTLVEEHPPGSGKRENIFTHRIVRDHRCAAESQPDQPIYRLDDRKRDQCIVGYRASLPTNYTRIIFGNTPYPRVRMAGFPVLSSENLTGTYFMIVERVSGSRVDPIAQSFRHVREPMPLIFGMRALGFPGQSQTVGARIDQYEALNQIMGWLMKGRLPSQDPKPLAPAFAPGTPTVLVCDEKKIPISCELRLAPKS